MRGVFKTLLLLAAFGVCSTTVSLAAQVEPASAPSEVRFDEETGERYVEARPSEPIRRGSVVTQPWVIYVAGGVVGAAALFFLARRLRASNS